MIFCAHVSANCAQYFMETCLAYALILRVRKQCLNKFNHQHCAFKMIYFIQTG